MRLSFIDKDNRARMRLHAVSANDHLEMLQRQTAPTLEFNLEFCGTIGMTRRVISIMSATFSVAFMHESSPIAIACASHRCGDHCVNIGSPICRAIQDTFLNTRACIQRAYSSHSSVRILKTRITISRDTASYVIRLAFAT